MLPNLDLNKIIKKRLIMEWIGTLGLAVNLKVIFLVEIESEKDG